MLPAWDPSIHALDTQNVLLRISWTRKKTDLGKYINYVKDRLELWILSAVFFQCGVSVQMVLPICTASVLNHHIERM